VPIDLGSLGAGIPAGTVSALGGDYGVGLRERRATDRSFNYLQREEMMAKAKAKRKAKAPKKVPFGGYQISFKGCTDTLDSLFGSAPMPPSDMTKRLWDYVKRRRLATKG
jgi:hypothetical protein